MITQYTHPLKKNGKNTWTKEQDKYLLTLSGTKSWNVVAEKVNLLSAYSNKTPQDCNKRWHALMNGVDTKEPWSIREEVNMLKAHRKHKNKWVEIGNMMKKRSNNTIKNKFYSIFRRVRGKIQKLDYTYCNKLELLEIYYIISIIEEYSVNQPTSVKTKGRRGKDFIYTLIHNISLKEALEYKEHMQRLSNGEGDMEKLFEELSNDNTIPVEKSRPEIMSKDELKEDLKIEQTLSVKPTNVEESKEIIANEEGLSKTLSSMMFDELFVSRNYCTPIKLESDDYFYQFKAPEQEILEMGFVSPRSTFSPLPLSAGPAAAAANALGAACFNEVPFARGQEGFADISFIAKKLNEKSRNSLA